MARVILEMDVHCTDCAKKIRKAVENYLGVEDVRASLQTGLVVISGTADAEVLRRRIQHKLRRPVNIVSHGAAAAEPVDAGWGLPNHWAAPPQFAPPNSDWGMPHPQPAYGYQYGARNHWAAPPPLHRYVSHGVPARHDDEEGPEACCSIQ